MNVKYLRKYNRYGMTTLCRICLTQSTADMSLLETNLKDEDSNSPTILEALSYVMACQIFVDSKLPSFVCPMCLGLLKIAYDLKEMFATSQESLKGYFAMKGDNLDGLVEVPPSSYEAMDYFKQEEKELNNSASVELVIGNRKFNIRDVVVVEEDEDEGKNAYKGFLKNLGSTVSASFCNTPKVKACAEPKPEVFLKKISKQMLNTHIINEIAVMPLENIDDIENLKSNIELAMGDSQINSENVGVNTNIGSALEDAEIGHVNLDKNNLNASLDNLGVGSQCDQSLIKSALNMIYQCSRCKKVYATEGRIKKHVALCGKEAAKICHICDKIFRCRALLREHLNTKHKIKVASNTKLGICDAVYTCEICGQVFYKKNMFRYHLVKHKGKTFMCEVCGKHFYTKHNVKTHMQMHQKQETKVLCPICGKGFHYQSGLYYHMRFHKNERKYRCNYCDKTFYMVAALKRHIRTHTGQRPYICNVCDKSFASSGELRKHSYLHTGFRPHHCKYCKRGYTSKFNLKLHLMTHPGTILCELCDKSFIDTEILSFHMRHKHNVKEEAATSRVFKQDDDNMENEEIIASVEVDTLEQFQLLTSF